MRRARVVILKHRSVHGELLLDKLADFRSAAPRIELHRGGDQRFGKRDVVDGVGRVDEKDAFHGDALLLELESGFVGGYTTERPSCEE